jgi:hypothetical protein
MKKIILMVTLCCIQYCVFSQDIDTLIDIKGYYVTIFSKQEIIFSYEQKIKKEKGLSYAIPIDYKQSSFFIPLQVGNKLVCENGMIIEKILNYAQNDSVYVIINAHNIDLLKKINIVTADVSKETCILSNAMRFSPYYEIIGNDKVLFNCTYIEGYALHKPIEAIEKKWQNYLLDIYFIDTKMENAEFFFIVEINDYTPYIEVPKIKKWLPYLE